MFANFVNVKCHVLEKFLHPYLQPDVRRPVPVPEHLELLRVLQGEPGVAPEELADVPGEGHVQGRGLVPRNRRDENISG